MSESTPHSHPCHTQDLPRINRVVGQVEGIKRMIQEGRYCIDIVTQLRAAQSALKSVEHQILKRHISSCVKDTLNSDSQTERQAKIDELIHVFSKT